MEEDAKHIINHWMLHTEEFAANHEEFRPLPVWRDLTRYKEGIAWVSWLS